MPIGYTIDEDEGLLFVRLWGRVTAADVQAHREAMAGDARFDRALRVLADLRAISVVDVSSEFVRGFRSPLTREAKRAILAGSDVGYGMAMMYTATAASPDSALVSYDVEEVVAWLGLPEAYAMPSELDVTFGDDATGERPA